MDPHAQHEIRVYADAMYELIKPIVPVSAEAFEQYRLNGMFLTSLEVDALRNNAPIATENKREQREWESKRQRLGLE